MEVKCVGSEHFSVDAFLVEHIGRLPSGAALIGADPRRAQSGPGAPFPAQWRDVCALTLPPNGFSSQPWWNDKVARKEKWQQWGLDPDYLVPTLYHTYFSRTERVFDEADSEADYRADEAGEFALCWPQPSIRHVPADEDCAVALRRLLAARGSFVVKPIEGNRAEGVMLVTMQDAHNESAVDRDRDALVAVRRHTSEVRLIGEDEEYMSFDSWYQRCVVENAHLKTGILAGWGLWVLGCVFVCVFVYVFVCV